MVSEHGQCGGLFVGSLRPRQGADITGGGDGARIIVTGNPVIDRGERDITRWFNTSVFARPARGDFGNAPKDVIRLPGTHSWDVSLFKYVPLKWERTSLQFRWEL